MKDISKKTLKSMILGSMRSDPGSWSKSYQGFQHESGTRIEYEENGPSIEYPDGNKVWSISKKVLTREDFLDFGLDFILKMQAAEFIDPRDLLKLKEEQKLTRQK